IRVVRGVIITIDGRAYRDCFQQVDFLCVVSNDRSGQVNGRWSAEMPRFCHGIALPIFIKSGATSYLGIAIRNHSENSSVELIAFVAVDNKFRNVTEGEEFS